jgi:hypothetical protein
MRRNVDAIASGTIIIGTTKDGYAVLAADRMASTWENGTSVPAGFHRKISLHDRLPIAIATAGLVYVFKHGISTHPKFVRTKTCIRFILNRLTSLDASTLPFIKAQYGKLMRPGILKAREESSQNPATHEKCNVVVAIALFYEDAPQLHAIGLDFITGNIITEDHCAFILNPPSINDLYKKTEHDKSTYKHFLGEHETDPDRLSRHIHDSIARGIRVEAENHGGQNLECGGTIDVAMVDARGARFVYLNSKRL